MIDKGANPFVVNYDGETWADETRGLSNLPTQKSVYFTIRPLEGDSAGKSNFPDPWFYQTLRLAQDHGKFYRELA